MRKKKVLVIDDSNTIVMLERVLLSSANYEVISAGDGEEGLAVAASACPDLILLDVEMPKLDGFQTCARLKSLAATKRIPVIMVTTRGDVSHVERGRAAGADDYVTKPVRSADLVARIEKLTSK